MANYVHFKFKSQKEPQRLLIDGPHISVWDLKREIIAVARLGDGTDFDLKIYDEGTNEGKQNLTLSNAIANALEEYTDDNDQVKKDSTVLARRLPAAIPGKGRAARYVSGKRPVNSIASASTVVRRNNKTVDMDSAQTEEERVKAMFNLNQAQWQQKQEEMAQEQRVPISGSRPSMKKSNVPEGEPPHGYICYRCGKKGHWIQACPTNDDANYDNKNRIKRTTGIPRSMLKKIAQEDIDKLDESQRQNLMVNAEGEYVFAQADEKEWRKHLDKVKATEAAQKQVVIGDKELQDRGLECPIDKRMFVDPMKTPCCGKTYCHDCIENALLENDLTCPGCQTENVSLERLEPDEDMKAEIKIYEIEKAQAGKRSRSASARAQSPEVPEGKSLDGSRSGSRSPATSDSAPTSKKRTADEAADDRSSSLTAPAMKRQKSGEEQNGTGGQDKQPSTSASSVPENPFANMMPPDMSTMMQQMQQMMPMPMSMPGMPFMPMPGMMNPMMGNFMPPNFNMNMMNGMFPPMNNNFNPMMNGNNFNNPFPNLTSNQQQPQAQRPFQNQQHHHNTRQQHPNTNSPMTGMQGVPTGPKSQRNPSQTPAAAATYPPTGPANTKFSNQQRHVGREEDNAYMRQPVNPHRSQQKGKRGMRVAEYKEL